MYQSFRNAITDARRHPDLYFAALVDQQTILNALGSASSLWQSWIYTPAVTVWVFLSQCLSSDHSCRDAVARLIAWRVARGEKPCSSKTGAYCIARNDLPEAACRPHPHARLLQPAPPRSRGVVLWPRRDMRDLTVAKR